MDLLVSTKTHLGLGLGMHTQYAASSGETMDGGQTSDLFADSVLRLPTHTLTRESTQHRGLLCGRE
jgi:hypothetical protein